MWLRGLGMLVTDISISCFSVLTRWAQNNKLGNRKTERVHPFGKLRTLSPGSGYLWGSSCWWRCGPRGSGTAPRWLGTPGSRSIACRFWMGVWMERARSKPVGRAQAASNTHSTWRRDLDWNKYKYVHTDLVWFLWGDKRILAVFKYYHSFSFWSRKSPVNRALANCENHQSVFILPALTLCFGCIFHFLLAKCDLAVIP